MYFILIVVNTSNRKHCIIEMILGCLYHVYKQKMDYEKHKVQLIKKIVIVQPKTHFHLFSFNRNSALNGSGS